MESEGKADTKKKIETKTAPLSVSQRSPGQVSKTTKTTSSPMNKTMYQDELSERYVKLSQL